MKVKLNSIESVKDFVTIVSKYDTDIDLVSQRYVVDAKSILGVFSLDLNIPMRVDIHDKEMEDEIYGKISKYLVA